MKSFRILIVILIIIGVLVSILLLRRPLTPSEIIEDEGILLGAGTGRNVLHLVEPPLCQRGDGPREIAKRASKKFIVESNNIDLFRYQYQLVKVWGSLKKEKRERPVICFKAPCPPIYEDQLVMNVEKIEISDKVLSYCQEVYLRWMGKEYSIEATPIIENQPILFSIKIAETPTGLVSVKSEPRTIGTEEIEKVRAGQKFDVVDESNGWYKIKCGNYCEGWVKSQDTVKE